MSELVQQLVDAQVDWWVERVSGDAYTHWVQDECQAFYLWAETQPMATLMPDDVLHRVLLRFVQQWPDSEQLLALMQTTLNVWIDALQEADTVYADILDEARFIAWLQHAAEQHEWRQHLLREVLGSGVYRQFITDMLYDGIRSYLLEENALAAKVPGVASIMKVGRWGLNKMPQFEQYAESTIKAYLDSNLQRTLRLSEDIVNRMLAPESLARIGRDVWREYSNYRLGQPIQGLQPSAVSETVAMAWQQWLSARQHRVVDVLVRAAVTAWQQQCDEQTVGAWLQGLGLKADVLALWWVDLTRPGLQQMIDDGYLQTRIRQQALAFYRSDAVEALLS